MSNPTIDLDHEAFEGMEYGLSKATMARIRFKQRLRRQHRNLAFEAWAVALINRERRPYFVMGCLFGLLVTILPWYGLQWLLADYVHLPFNVSHFAASSVVGVAVIHYFTFVFSKPRMRLVQATIQAEALKRGITP